MPLADIQAAVVAFLSDKTRNAQSAASSRERVHDLGDVPLEVCRLVQWLDPNGTGRVVTQEVESAARRFRRLAQPKAAHSEREARGVVQQLHRTLKQRVKCANHACMCQLCSVVGHEH